VIRVGISGWRYQPWRGVFYPEGLPQRRELEYAARHFSTIEINGSFYSLQRPEYYEEWYDAAPRGFVYAVKGSRYITHMLRLKGAPFDALNLMKKLNLRSPAVSRGAAPLPFRIRTAGTRVPRSRAAYGPRVRGGSAWAGAGRR